MRGRHIAIAVGAATIHAADQVSSTLTGSHHYLSAPQAGMNWRVRGSVVHYELHGTQPVRDCAIVCRCRRCKALKLRKGGRNAGHVFICADCIRGKAR